MTRTPIRTSPRRGDAPRPSRVLRAGAVAGAALLLFGCSSPDATGGGSAAPDDSAALTSLKVVVGPVATEPLYYGIDSGVFEEHGLDVELVEGGFLPAQQVPVLLSGDGDVSLTGGLTLVAGVIEGLPVQAVLPWLTAGTQPEPDSGFIVAADSGFEDFGDLNGTTIAVPGLNEIAHLAVVYAIAEQGGDPSTVEFLEMPITNVNDAIVNGQIDGAFQISTFYSQALDAGLTTFGDPANEYFAGASTLQVMATNEWIAGNEETLDRFHEALVQIVDELEADPEAIRDVQRAHTELPDEVIDSAILPTYVTSFDQAGYERLTQIAYEYGFLTEDPAFDTIVWSGAPID